MEHPRSNPQSYVKTPPKTGPKRSPPEIAAFNKAELRLAALTGCSGYSFSKISLIRGKQRIHLNNNL